MLTTMTKAKTQAIKDLLLEKLKSLSPEPLTTSQCFNNLKFFYMILEKKKNSTGKTKCEVETSIF